MKGDRPRKPNPPGTPPRRPRGVRPPTRARAAGVRVPETLIEKTVRTAVYVVRHRQAVSVPGLSGRVQQLVRETLMALADQKWKLIRMVLWAVGMAGVAAGLAVSQLLADSSLLGKLIPKP